VDGAHNALGRRPRPPLRGISRGVIPTVPAIDPSVVIAGLDPAIHSVGISIGWRGGMDARVKHGHDGKVGDHGALVTARPRESGDPEIVPPAYWIPACAGTSERISILSRLLCGSL